MDRGDFFSSGVSDALADFIKAGACGGRGAWGAAANNDADSNAGTTSDINDFMDTPFRE
jgi:hypothetical protein